MSNIEIGDDFVGVFDDVFSEETIDGMIQIIDELAKNNLMLDRRQDHNVDAHVKDDIAYSMITRAIESRDFTLLSKVGLLGFTETFWNVCWEEYTKKYSVLRKVNQYRFSDIKLQRIEPGQGYHVWHFERDGKFLRHQAMTFLMYLNDIEDGGETEFLYLRKRIQPRRNRMLIFPSDFTHTHRGNPPLTQTKDIVTGWIEFAN